MQTPKLTFFCEVPENELAALFSDTTINTLKKLNASVSMGLLDLGDKRAEMVKQLNDAGIPMIAWLLLPVEQGYWFNINNYQHAQRRYDDFKAWTAKHDLQWEAVGLDIEPDRQEIESMMADRSSILPRLAAKWFDSYQLANAKSQYLQLVAQIRSDGYLVESYHIPFVLDEDRVGSTLLGRLAGLFTLPVDREVLMLYTSFMSVGALSSYAPEAQYIGVGSTGGGVDIGDALKRTLSWDDLARDLSFSARYTDRIYVFSLEGCIQQGYLQRLVDFDWTVAATIPEEQAKQFQWIRRGVRGVLWASAHPREMMVGLLFLRWVLSRRRTKTKRLSN